MASTRRWEKWIAEIAKLNGEALIYVVIDMRHVPKEPRGEGGMAGLKQFAIEGSFDPQAGHELFTFIKKWHDKTRRKPGRKTAKKQKGREAGRG